jgi:hypothetical protein
MWRILFGIELDRYSGTVTVGGVDYIVDLIQFENREDLGFVEAERVFYGGNGFSIVFGFIKIQLWK